jgi:type IV secretory pathway TrbD component
MKLKASTELVALAVAVLAVATCVVGLGVATWPWLGWSLGLLLSAVAAVRLGARALDERTIRAAQAQHREKTLPEPPYRPAAPDQL